MRRPARQIRALLPPPEHLGLAATGPPLAPAPALPEAARPGRALLGARSEAAARAGASWKLILCEPALATPSGLPVASQRAEQSCAAQPPCDCRGHLQPGYARAESLRTSL